MGDDGLNLPNWVNFGSSLKGQSDPQLGWLGVREAKSFLPVGEPGFALNANASCYVQPFFNDQLARQREYGVQRMPPLVTAYVKESWAYPQPSERFLNILSGANTAYGLVPGAHAMHMVQPVKAECLGLLDETVVPKEPVRTQKAKVDEVVKMPKMKKPRKDPSLTLENGGSGKRVKQPKKSVDVVINGITMDISRIPIPVCSCTGAPQQCYRWGSGGWQSACCTTMLSEHPLPMSTKRRGARIAGRKMSLGAFKKVLEKLASEGYDFSKAIDLRTHWAKHGTNKFVTIR
uniref:GAGA-binding transcriptional activator n=1 Tax=Kalanchoe fedtschenkoi TaxID=63787 RepID=A0A7N0UJG9_KALFE